MEVFLYRTLVVCLKKVSLYVDEEVWMKFREEVFKRYGSLRKLSSEVEALLRSSLIEDALASTFNSLGVSVSGTISSENVKQGRPLLRGPPSEEIIREMRGKRAAKALPRQ
jgi:hypothetical protein